MKQEYGSLHYEEVGTLPMLVHLLAWEMSDRIAAIATLAGPF